MHTRVVGIGKLDVMTPSASLCSFRNRQSRKDIALTALHFLSHGDKPTLFLLQLGGAFQI